MGTGPPRNGADKPVWETRMADDTTTDSTADDDGTDDQTTTTTTGSKDPDWKAEAERWKSRARQAQDHAKANASAQKELEELKKAGMSDTEKAVAEAKEAGRVEGLAKGQARVVAAEIRAQGAARLPAEQLKELVANLDLTKFVGADGEVDEKKVTKLIDAVAPKRAADLGQGARGSNGGPADMNALIRSRMAR